MKRYKVYSLDVWGHAPDKCVQYACGRCVCDDRTHNDDVCDCDYWVDDRARVGGITLPDDASDATILEMLDMANYVHADMCEVDDTSDDAVIYIRARSTGRPLLTLESEES